MTQPDPTVTLLAAILCGTATSWPGEGPDPEDAVEAAVAHGVAPLLARAIGRPRGAWPRVFSDGLTDAARGETALAVVRQRALTPVLAALGAGGVRVLAIKGAHLAHVVYESPELRPRRDTDLLIDETDRDRTRAILARLDYASVPHVSGALVMTQSHVRRDDPSGAAHQLDVHWRLAVPQAFSALPALADLWDASMPIPALGPTARAPSLADALLVACAHRAAHHSEASALIWIVDVQRIAERLSDTEAARFVERAARARVRAVAGQALSLARELLGARLAPALAALASEPVGRGELTAACLSPVSSAQGLALDLRALNGWSARTRLLREHLFPPRVYMRAYAPDSRWPLPALPPPRRHRRRPLAPDRGSPQVAVAPRILPAFSLTATRGDGSE